MRCFLAQPLPPPLREGVAPALDRWRPSRDHATHTLPLVLLLLQEQVVFQMQVSSLTLLEGTAQRAAVAKERNPWVVSKTRAVRETRTHLRVRCHQARAR